MFKPLPRRAATTSLLGWSAAARVAAMSVLVLLLLAALWGVSG
jgi:hypothetical protein